MNIPTIFDWLARSEPLRGYPAVIIILVTASLIALFWDWRLALFALIVQYLDVSLLFADLLDPRLAVIKLLVGMFVCLILYMTARQINYGRVPDGLTAKESRQTNARKQTISCRALDNLPRFCHSCHRHRTDPTPNIHLHPAFSISPPRCTGGVAPHQYSNPDPHGPRLGRSRCQPRSNSCRHGSVHISNWFRVILCRPGPINRHARCLGGLKSRIGPGGRLPRSGTARIMACSAR